MSLLSLIFALLLEQFRPLSSRNVLSEWLFAYVDWFRQYFDAGEKKHGMIAWVLAMLLPLVISTFLYWILAKQHPVFAWLFCVLVLYLTMGFRQFSHYFTNIHKALRDDDLPKARSLLSTWKKTSCHDLTQEEVVRLTLEQALLATHRNVFAVAVWFVIFMQLGLGPTGAIFYRMTRFLKTKWSENNQDELVGFGKFPAQIYHWVEWLPMRLTASTFAIVGNFEDAIYCWRNQASSWPDSEGGIVLSSGAGALGVRLGMPLPHLGETLERPELGVGDEADIDFMQSAVGLVWRALVFWLIMLLLLTLTSMVSWVGI